MFALSMKNKVKYVGILSFLPLLLTAQSGNLKTLQREADRYFKDGEYAKALESYLQINDNPNVVVGDEDKTTYNIGFCYYNLPAEKQKSIPYFQKYLENNQELFEAYYFLGKMHHESGSFDLAIENYNQFKINLLKDTLAPKEVNENLTEIINRDIESCNYAKSFVRTPREVIIENLGENINTSYQEYAPVISPDESTLIFTSRRPGGYKKNKSDDGDYYEDIYKTHVLEGSLFKSSEDKIKAGYVPTISDFNFSEAKLMNENINSEWHEGAVQFSYDAKKLFIYRNSQVWVSEKHDTTWQKLRVLKEIDGATDKNAFEPSVSISQEGDIIYISSDRKGGYGGLDIYESRKQRDGTWSKAVNLGSTINTPYDEDAPYIDPNGRTLYFSSKGHSSMGGFDVFKSVYNDEGKWGAPENMGFPINSPGDDIFFMMTPKYNRAYYSSNKQGGYGQMDIYRITFADERPPLAEIKGLILHGDSMSPARSKIITYDLEYNEEISQHYSDSLTGRYHLVFGYGKDYKVKIETPGFVVYEKVFSIPKQVHYYHYYQEIHHVYIKDKLGNVIGQQVTLHTAKIEPQKKAKEDPVVVSENKIAKLLQTSDADFSGIKIQQLLRDSTVSIDIDSVGKFKYIDSENYRFQLSKKISDAYLALYDEKGDSINGSVIDKDSLTFSFTDGQTENALVISDVNPNTMLSADVVAENENVTVESTDILFFVSEDSLVSILEEDTSLAIVLPENASLAFFEAENTPENRQNPDSYKKKSKIVEQVSLNQDADSLYGIDTLDVKIKEEYNHDLVEKFNNDTTSKFTFLDSTKSKQKTYNIRDILVKKTQKKSDSLVFDSLKGKLNIIDTNTSEAFIDSVTTKKDTLDIQKLVVLFGYDNTKLSDSEKEVIGKIVDYMKRNKVANIEIIGHTDNKGEDAYNLRLSTKRAAVVKKYFVSQGITSTRIKTKGVGESEPIAPNVFVDGSDNEEGRKLNRRVEFKISQ